ncbi:MAG: hypothetical protein U9O86_04560 [Campylobacterota bacterium]|nr:hypothetical protein [Campylobacterota bacterium]
MNLISSLGLELFSQYSKGYALYDTKDKVELFNTPPSTPSMRMKDSLSKLTKAQIILNREVLSISTKENSVKVLSSSSEYEADYLIYRIFF